jgi:hypothetical protein
VLELAHGRKTAAVPFFLPLWPVALQRM